MTATRPPPLKKEKPAPVRAKPRLPRRQRTKRGHLPLHRFKLDPKLSPGGRPSLQRRHRYPQRRRPLRHRQLPRLRPSRFPQHRPTAAAQDVKRSTSVDGPPSTFKNNLGMEFVYIPPGKFMMGSSHREKGRYPDESSMRSR